MQFAPAIWGLPVVASTAERNLLFPTPLTNQRVQNLGTGQIERWTGTAWVKSQFDSVPALDIRAFGAVGDGITDDTLAIQAAIDASPIGGSVFVPPGYYFKYSRLSSTRPVRLIGAGYSSSLQELFGATAWSDSSRFSGSVLICVATSGDSLSLGTAGTNQNLQLQDLMIVGPGTGTTVGVHAIRSVGSYFQNVLVANFYQGWHADNVQDSTFAGIRAKGCKTSMLMDGTITSNQCVLLNPEFQSYDTFGLHLSAAAGVAVYGGLFQDGRGGYAVQMEEFCTQNKLDTCWFENTSGMSGGINLIGSFNRIVNTNFGSVDDSIVVSSGANGTRLLDNYLQPGVNVTINAGATNTYSFNTEPTSGGTFTDNGTGTIREYVADGVLVQASGNRSIGGSDTIGGTVASAGTATRLVKKITGMSDGTYTVALTVTVPNAAQSATLALALDASLGAGGSVGANEGTQSVAYNIAITRTPGATVTAAVSSAIGSVQTAVSGGATPTVALDASLVSGGSSATQAVSLRVSVTRSSGASTNHTCVLRAELLNTNGSGITIA